MRATACPAIAPQAWVARYASLGEALGASIVPAMKALSILPAAFLVGCVVAPATPEYLGEPPICEGEADCTAKWEAAQLYVVKTAGFKIQVVTNVLIETYNSTGSSTDLAMRVTKEPLGGGRYKLVATAQCANLFGCTPSPSYAVSIFNSTVSSATP